MSTITSPHPWQHIVVLISSTGVAIDGLTSRRQLIMNHDQGVYKDGLHLHLQGIVTRPEVQHLLRAAMLPHTWTVPSTI